MLVQEGSDPDNLDSNLPHDIVDSPRHTELAQQVIQSVSTFDVILCYSVSLGLLSGVIMLNGAFGDCENTHAHTHR